MYGIFSHFFDELPHGLVMNLFFGGGAFSRMSNTLFMLKVLKMLGADFDLRLDH